MMAFAVHIDELHGTGMKVDDAGEPVLHEDGPDKGKQIDLDKQGSWVLEVDATDGEGRVLISHPDKTLHWYGMADCKLANIKTPDMPSMVVVVQPQPQNGKIHIAGSMPPPNRMERRRGGA